MYRKRGYRSLQRRREELRSYLCRIVTGLSIVCIIIVCAAVAVKTRKATQSVEAATAQMQSGTVTVKTRARDTLTQEQPAVSETGSEEREDKRDDKEETAMQEAQSEEASVIVIDPGHGGVDGGCVFGNIVEKDINRMIAARVVVRLREMGYQAELAREGDDYIDKMERVENANARNALLYVSIHQNSCEDESVAGIETWYDGTDAGRDSGRLAQLIQQETVRETGAVSRELIADSELCVTSKSTMPSCLIETGFLSNEEERGRLITGAYRDQLAAGIASGIDRYLNPKTMYLTFDDGPSAENTSAVLDTLKEKNIKATFFLIGENVKKHPDVAKRIAEEGHTIGIHCNWHDYKQLYASVDSYLEDFEKAYQTVEEVTGVQAKLFRFPGGSINSFNKEVYEDIIREMTDRGFVYFDWNASLEDAVGHPETDILIQNAVSSTRGRKRVVMLAHDVIHETAGCLKELLGELPEYRMEPLTEEVKPIQF